MTRYISYFPFSCNALQCFVGLLAGIVTFVLTKSSHCRTTQAEIFFANEYQQISPLSVVPVNA